MAIDTRAPLRSRVAIVTGVSRRNGIGAAIAEALAADGWSLLLTGYSAADRAQELAGAADGVEAIADSIARSLAEGPSLLHQAPPAAASSAPQRVEAMEMDLSDPASIDPILTACVGQLGPPSALVNNAAVNERGGIDAVDAGQLDRHWVVNARAAMLLTAGFARRFVAATGAVVSLTSGQSLGAMPDELAYAASKGALEAFTISAAAALAPRGIRVNAVDPGPTDTGWMTGSQRTALAAPLGRVGEPADAARLVRYLCSDEARWITGQILRSRGGL